MKHYIDDDGDRLDVEVPDYFVEDFYKLFLHEIMNGSESESDMREKLRTEIKETEWSLYGVLRSYEIAKSLGGSGDGPTVDTLFDDDPQNMLVLNMYKWWCSLDMYPGEFQLWWHDFLMRCWFSCFSFKKSQ